MGLCDAVSPPGQAVERAVDMLRDYTRHGTKVTCQSIRLDSSSTVSITYIHCTPRPYRKPPDCLTTRYDRIVIVVAYRMYGAALQATKL